jgi:oligosaccharyltransferase complex subunit delta (ribophorin II)
MRFSIAPALLLLAGAADAATKWTFSDAVVKVVAKGADTVTYKFTETEAAKAAVKLGPTGMIKLSLTTKEGSKAKKPHQAFVVLSDSETGLEVPFPLTLKESGAGSVDIAQKDIPVQLLTAERPLDAKLLLGSFGPSVAASVEAFRVEIERDPNASAPKYEAPLRYGKQPEINHIFRADPKNPPKIVSIVFAAAVLAAIPAVLIGWTALGGNVAHLPKALSNAPISHSVFFGSIVAMEGALFLYYTSWKLLDILPLMIVIGATAFLSGSKALGEVQSRRLAGER